MAAKKRRQQVKKKAVNAQAAAAKQARREERKRAEAEAKRKAARNRRIRLAAIVAGSAAVLLVAGFFVFRPDPELPGVERPAFAGSEHIAQGASVDYGTATPTSGDHDPRSTRCGLFTEFVPLEFAVHGLEHGVVVIWYRPDLEDELVPQLADLIEKWDSHVMVSPNPGIEEPIVATAWNRLKRYDGVTDDLADFVDTYRRRGPESIDCAI